MSKQQKTVKQNKKLLNANIAKKFGIAFTSITYGILFTVIFAMLAFKSFLFCLTVFCCLLMISS